MLVVAITNFGGFMSYSKISTGQQAAQTTLINHLKDGENLTDGSIMTFGDKEFKINQKQNKNGESVFSSSKKNFGFFDRIKSWMMTAFGFEQEEDYVSNLFESSAVNTILHEYKRYNEVQSDAAKLFADNLRDYFKTDHWLKIADRSAEMDRQLTDRLS